MKKLLATGIVLLALLAILAGCSTTTSSATGPRIDSISTEVLSADQTTTSADGTSETTPVMNVKVGITVSNFSASATGTTSTTDTTATATTSTEQTGHYMYYMDDIPENLKNMIPVELLPAGTAETTTTTTETTMTTTGAMMGESSTDTTYTWENVDPGYHVFAVQLVDSDGMSLDPAVVAVVIISVPETEMMTPTSSTTTTTSTSTTTSSSTETTTTSTETTTP
jgi:hypothetical protein